MTVRAVSDLHASNIVDGEVLVYKILGGTQKANVDPEIVGLFGDHCWIDVEDLAPEPEVPTESRKVSDLRAEAHEKGVEGVSKMNKSELIAALAGEDEDATLI